MKRWIIKTSLITLAATVLTLVVVYFFLMLAFPRVLAKGWEAVGSYDLSMRYYEKQYEASKEMSDLSVLCVKVDVEKDTNRAEKYLAIMTKSSGFSEFCASEDADTAQGYGFTAYEFYFGKYAVASYYKYDITAAVNVAKIATQNGYSEHNAFYVILSGVKTLTAADGQAIESAVSEIKAHLTDAAQIANAERDENIARSIYENI